MRFSVLLASTMLLAACGGAGPQSLGEYTPPGGGGGATDPATGQPHTFVNPTKTTTYAAQGGSQHYEYERNDPRTNDPADPYETRDQTSQLYDSNSTENGSNALSVKYDRDDSEFALTFKDGAATVDFEILYQDPGHRTAFGGAVGPQWGNENLTSQTVFYVEGGSINNLIEPTDGHPYPFILAPGKDSGTADMTTFFYQKPGTVTKYVTYAGYVRNIYEVVAPSGAPPEYSFKFDRGTLVFGEQTERANAPTTGTGSFSGPMLASMIFNNSLDAGEFNNYFQWIVGSANVNVDFAATTFSIAMNGEVKPLQVDVGGINPVASMPAGSIFNAAGNGRFDGGLPIYRTFGGAFTSATFTRPDGTVFTMQLADPYSSANTIDGSFYGPKGEEVGGTFRLSNGEPDTRVDILGVFTGR